MDNGYQIVAGYTGTEPVLYTDVGNQLRLTSDVLANDQSIINGYITAARQNIENMGQLCVLEQTVVQYNELLEPRIYLMRYPFQGVAVVQVMTDSGWTQDTTYQVASNGQVASVYWTEGPPDGRTLPSPSANQLFGGMDNLPATPLAGDLVARLALLPLP